MQVQFVDYIPGSTTPARVFHKTGVIQINRSRWNQIKDPFHKKFIIQHEKGHYLGKTNNELFADEYAFNALKGTEQNSLKKSITALSDNLPPSPLSKQRITAQTVRALKADAFENKNKKAFELLKLYFPEEVQNISSFDELPSNAVFMKLLPERIVIIATIIAVIVLIFLIIRK